VAHLIQILLPVYDDAGRPFPAGEFSRVGAELTDRFGGLTAYTRVPAEGLWQEGEGRPTHDDIVVYEVMTDELDRQWWAAFRNVLEERFAQEELVIRAHPIERL
jgi:crotonobetainyl-CoA:carnitine CoA-transferase CaiB-like acyl-CoA transferase